MVSVSTSKGTKKGAQRHQNSFAFKPSKHSVHAQKIASIPTQNLCQRCFDIIEWRKRMGKYKPLTTAKKCTRCERKNIKDAYRVVCNECAEAAGKVCPKCLEAKELISNVKDEEEDPKAYESD